MKTFDFKPLLVLASFSVCCLVVTACGPSLKETVDLSNEQYFEKISNPPRTDYLLSVETLADYRVEEPLIVKGSSKSKLIGDAGIIVEREIRSSLANRGFTITSNAPLILTGAVKKWQATVSPGISSNVKSEAIVFIELLDPANKVIYKANYTGFASESHPSLDEKDLTKSLARAMREALGELLEDKELFKLMKSF